MRVSAPWPGRVALCAAAPSSQVLGSCRQTHKPLHNSPSFMHLFFLFVLSVLEPAEGYLRSGLASVSLLTPAGQDHGIEELRAERGLLLWIHGVVRKMTHLSA